MVKLMPGYAYDVAAWQARLEDLAAGGWFYRPSWTFFFLASFERREPRAVRYRLEPAGRREKCPDQERRDTYRALGWEYVDTIGRAMHLWRCDDPDVPELHTDPQTEARAYEWMSRRDRRGVLACAGLLAFFAGLAALLVCCSGGGYFARQAASWNPLWKEAGLWGFWLAIAAMAGWQIRSMKRYIKTLGAGVPAPRRRPYRRSCALALAVDLMWVFYIVSLWSGPSEESRTFRELDAYDEPVPHVSVLPDGEVLAVRQDNWLTADQWWTVEQEADSLSSRLESEAHYFRLRFPSLADDLAASIRADYEDSGWPVAQAEYPGLDEVWCGERENGYRCLVLRLGDQVWDVGFWSDRPAEELLAEYAAVLAEFA